MVPVRKPGRPLSSCPCAPGRPCACGGVKVAIPRKQKCHCGSGEEHQHPPDETTPEAAPAAESPLSPTRAVYRVQKSGPNPRQNGSRKQSFDRVNLDRMDPNSVNILKPYDGQDRKQPLMATNGSVHPQLQAATVGPRPVYHTPPIPNGFENANFGGAAPIHYDMSTLPHMTPPNLPPTGKSENGAARAHPPQPHAAFPSQSPVALTNGSGSCCAPPPQVPTFDSTPAPKTNGSNSRSCCCGPNSASPEIKPVAMAPQHTTQANGAYMQQIQTPMEMKHQQFPVAFHQPAIYTYPAEYGSWSHPINQAMWTQVQNLQQNAVAYANAIPVTTSGNNGSVPSISHECNCGPGCQCVGCLAHPFNQEMLQYVGGAWDYDMDVPRPEVYGSNVSPGTGHPNGHLPGAAVNAVGGGGAAGQPLAQKPEPSSPPQAPTPSDASVCSDDHALSASDYFFVNLPLFPGADPERDACGGSQALCPCGDDCQCDGCVVHNSKPLETFG